MDNKTFRSRLVELMQRSRRAMRAYASISGGINSGRTDSVKLVPQSNNAHNGNTINRPNVIKSEAYRSEALRPTEYRHSSYRPLGVNNASSTTGHPIISRLGSGVSENKSSANYGDNVVFREPKHSSRFANITSDSATSGSLETEYNTLEYSELQAAQWRFVNEELLRLLGAALDQPNPRMLLPEVLSILDKLISESEYLEEDIQESESNLLEMAKRSEFIRVAIIARKLVMLKARLQATSAAYSELEQVVGKVRGSSERAAVIGQTGYTADNSRGTNCSRGELSRSSAIELDSEVDFTKDSELDLINSSQIIQENLPLFEEDLDQDKDSKTGEYVDNVRDPQKSSFSVGAKIIPLRKAFR